MVILLKHTLRNIIHKPFRSLILVFCMMVTCMTAYMALDFSGAIGGVITNYMSDMIGNADVQIRGAQTITPAMFEGAPEYNALSIFSHSYKIGVRDKTQYSYEYVKEINVLGLDLNAAYEMGVVAEKLTPGAQEVAVSKTYAKDFGLMIGDELTVLDKMGGPHTYRVFRVLEEDSLFVAKGEYTVVMSQEMLRDLLGMQELKSHFCLLDVKNDKQLDAFCDYLDEKFPTLEYVRVKGNETIAAAIAQTTMICMVMFVITFLMVIFVTVGLSERIVGERMSVIGTFKSLGISSRATTFILLLENITYGLLGAVLGTLLYVPVRGLLLTSILSGTDIQTTIDPIKWPVYVVIFVGAIVIECVCPIWELLKAVKTAIRDIIFGNKDTEYRLSKKRGITAGVLLALSCLIIVTMWKSNGILLLLAVVLLVVTVALFIPYILFGASKVLERVFVKLRMPVARLAAQEIGSKKSTVGNAVLGVTVSALAITVFTLASSMLTMVTANSCDADVRICGYEVDRDQFIYLESLEGVQEIQEVYGYTDTFYYDGVEQKDLYDILSCDLGDMVTGIEGRPDHMEDDEFAVSLQIAEKQGWKIGDEVEITFKPDFVFPITRKMKLAAILDTFNYETIPVFMLSGNMFENIYHNNCSEILIRCENPEKVKALIQSYNIDNSLDIETRAEIQETLENDGAGFKGIMYGVIVLGMVLTVIGISGNQVLGFEARKREFAVMCSTAMRKSQIVKLIFLETVFSMGISVLIAIFTGRILNVLLQRIARNIGMGIRIDSAMGDYFKMGVLLLLVLLLTSRSPIRALKKMKIAEQIKYE